MNVIRFLLLLSLTIATMCQASAAADKRPNFLFILTDDQSPETLNAYGQKVCETPNLDRLAA